MSCRVIVYSAVAKIPFSTTNYISVYCVFRTSREKQMTSNRIGEINNAAYIARNIS